MLDVKSGDVTETCFHEEPRFSYLRHIFPAVVEELADKFDDAPVLLSDSEFLTYRDLANRANQYARWALCSCPTDPNIWPSGSA